MKYCSKNLYKIQIQELVHLFEFVKFCLCLGYIFSTVSLSKKRTLLTEDKRPKIFIFHDSAFLAAAQILIEYFQTIREEDIAFVMSNKIQIVSVCIITLAFYMQIQKYFSVRTRRRIHVRLCFVVKKATMTIIYLCSRYSSFDQQSLHFKVFLKKAIQF